MAIPSLRVEADRLDSNSKSALCTPAKLQFRNKPQQTATNCNKLQQSATREPLEPLRRRLREQEKKVKNSSSARNTKKKQENASQFIGAGNDDSIVKEQCADRARARIRAI